MIYDQSDQKESQTIEALVPMVDLFAVLAIVFMIYASDEINITELTTAKKMQEVVETVEKMQEVVETIERESEDRIAEVERESDKRVQDVIDQYENDPNVILAKEAEKSLEEVKEKRKKKADELVAAFSAMLEAQQDQAADDYEGLVTSFEQKHEEALSEELVSLEELKQSELETERQQLIAEVEVEKSQLKEEQIEAIETVQLEAERELAEQESELVIEKMAPSPVK